MAVTSVINFGLFLLFPVACFLIRDNKEAHDFLFRVVPFVRASLAYIMIYLFAFRGINLNPTRARKVWAHFKYLFAACLMVVVKNLVLLKDLHEAQEFFTTDKIIKAFGTEELTEIGASYILMMLGYANLSKIPFFMTAHLWVIYYVNSYIFYDEVLKNYSNFKDGFQIVHDTTIASCKKFVRVTHEPPLAVALAGLLTFNLEVEMLLVSIFNHVLAIVAGYWAISNHTHPYVQLLTKYISPYIRLNTNRLQHDIAYLAITLVCSWHIHYWLASSRFISYFTGRRATFDIDPWTKPRLRTWGEKVVDTLNHVVEEAKHLGEEVVQGTQKALHVAKEGTVHAFEVSKDATAHAYENVKDGTAHAIDAVKHKTSDILHIKNKKRH